MIAKEKNHTRKTSTDILLGAFILVGISGTVLLYIKSTDNNRILNISIWWWSFIHRISALVSLLFTIFHVYKNRKWYEGFFSSKRKNIITVALSISFLITLLTTILFAIKRNSISLEILHSIMGSIAVVFALVHSLKRYHIIK